jgi:hypothetical protein
LCLIGHKTMNTYGGVEDLHYFLTFFTIREAVVSSARRMVYTQRNWCQLDRKLSGAHGRSGRL